MADENDERKSRAVVSLISVGVVLVIGFPVWWNTTKVYRATLPHHEILKLSELETNINIPLTIIFEQPGERKDFMSILSKKLNSEVKENHPVDLRFIINVREVNVEEKQSLRLLVNEVNLEALDDSIQELWKSNAEKIEYKFIVLSQQDELSKLARYAQCFVGKYRHAIILHNDDPTHLSDVIANVTKKVFIQEQVIKDAFYQHKNSDDLHEGIDEIRDLKSVTGFHLSFSLINDEPETGILNWNIKETIAEILQPFINKISYFDVSVDSQILHYSGVNLKPKTDGEVNYLDTEDLPHMINPIERKLGSFVSLNPSLNFIVFVPPKKQTPLKLKDVDGAYSPTNAFLSPRWGGVLIHNVYDRNEANDSAPRTITVDLTAIMKVFLTQIRLLVGIKPLTSQNGVLISTVVNSGARNWEVDNLLLVKTMEYLSSSAKTLTSLTQLMDKVKNMIIDDNIKVEIENALQSIKECQHMLSQGNITSAFMSAKAAIKSSEKAFFDPSMLELIYFPDDQKFAIYIPLFLPMSLPLIASLFAAIKWLRNKEGDESKTAPSKTAPSEKVPSETEPSETEPSDTEPSKAAPSETAPSDTVTSDTTE
ncbi:GPI transamidase component PIG-S-like [Dendronephthya gigantea]|uniref:GPI transamidase component PIG-S-like n=1 Tax=Dendronephthya gigantea TaxID=151771 RepID=UPI00106D852F|nr:GPI transamidase component PIG-S-like [Dendronephthya gigantea]